MTYKIAWVQPNFQQGPKEFNAHYLPYSAGVIWSYARTDDWVRDNFELTDMIWRRDAVEPLAQQLSVNNVVAFSTYVWNHQYNYTLARRVKELNPDCLIVFGGPEPAITDPDLFRKEPYMDLVICFEGEITFRELLRNFEQRNWENIPGLLINRSGEAVKTPDARRIETLEEVPSPYLTGVFDDIMARNPDVEWNGTLETNRGCPFACTFCDWGSLTYNKVKHFGLERVFEELEWMAKHRCGFISITDANFGMFPERDNMIADKIIEVQERYGYPKTFSVAWAKNQKREVVDIVKKLLDAPGFNQGLTLSVQSLDVGVLENIRRKNMEMNKLEEVFELCEQRNIPTYTELILGLPGETLQGWKDNFWRLFRMGNHTGLTVFQAQMLENAEMNLLQKKMFRITATRVTDYFSGSYSNEHIEEGIDIVTSTRDLPPETMLDAEVFSWYINTFHVNGVSTLLSRLVYKYLGIDYSNFYEDLFEFLKQDSWFAREMQEVRQYYANWMSDGRIRHPNIGGIEIHGWNLIHRSILNMHVDNQYDNIFALLAQFMARYDLPQDLLDDAMQFQRRYLIAYNDRHQYPMQLELNHNLWDYLTFDRPLEQGRCVYNLDFPEDKNMSFPRFLELFYFARRRNFGKAMVELVDGNTNGARRGEAASRASGQTTVALTTVPVVQ
jgi:tRNA A37 methylthiotransferase MiaB